MNVSPVFIAPLFVKSESGSYYNANNIEQITKVSEERNKYIVSTPKQDICISAEEAGKLIDIEA